MGEGNRPIVPLPICALEAHGGPYGDVGVFLSFDFAIEVRTSILAAEVKHEVLS